MCELLQQLWREWYLISVFRNILTQKAIGVLVSPPLAWAHRMGKVNLCCGNLGRNVSVIGKLEATV